MNESGPARDLASVDFAQLPGVADRLDADLAPLAQKVVDLLHRRWLIPILRELASGPKRFSYLEHSTGVARKVLCESLRDFTDQGLLCQVQVNDLGRPTFAYAVTPLGQSLDAILNALGGWGMDHLDEVRSCQASAQAARAVARGDA